MDSACSAPTVRGHGGSFPDRSRNLVLRTAAEGGLARLVKRGTINPQFRTVLGPGERGGCRPRLLSVHHQRARMASMFNSSLKAIYKAMPMAIFMVATAVSGWLGRSEKSVAAQ